MADNVTIAECDAVDELLDDYPSENLMSKKNQEEIEWVEIDDDEETVKTSYRVSSSQQHSKMTQKIMLMKQCISLRVKEMMR